MLRHCIESELKKPIQTGLGRNRSKGKILIQSQLTQGTGERQEEDIEGTEHRGIGP